MYVLLTCSKFSPQSLRIADVGDKDAAEVIAAMPPRECPVCGACSHVELAWPGYLTSMGAYATVDEARAARDVLLKSGGFTDG